MCVQTGDVLKFGMKLHVVGMKGREKCDITKTRDFHWSEALCFLHLMIAPLV